MDRRIALLALAAFAPAAWAGDGVEISAKSRTQAVAAAARAPQAPFSEQARDPLAELFTRTDAAARAPASHCEQASWAFCYDLGERRVVYRPARRYMPRVDGLTPESVSLRQDRIVLKYTFR